MFIARYENTMRSAKFAPQVAQPTVRTAEQIRADKRRKAAIETKRQADELAARQAEAKRQLEAVGKYRCIDVIGFRTSAKEIIRLVATAHGLTSRDLLGNRRFRTIVEARFDAIKAVADARPDLSLPQIGRIFGKDHTTILHALKQRGGRSSRVAGRPS